MLQYLPNCLTILRLLLAVPLGLLILQESYTAALAIGFLAGLTDALDGFAARRLKAFSRFGAALDPVADKVLVTVSFLSFAYIGLIPWYVAITVIGRDLVIVTGALCYHWVIGSFDFAATTLSKANMAIQICFCVMLLAAQLIQDISPELILTATSLVLVIAIASGLDYVITWAIKAMRERAKKQ